MVMNLVRSVVYFPLYKVDPSSSKLSGKPAGFGDEIDCKVERVSRGEYQRAFNAYHNIT